MPLHQSSTNGSACRSGNSLKSLLNQLKNCNSTWRIVATSAALSIARVRPSQDSFVLDS